MTGKPRDVDEREKDPRTMNVATANDVRDRINAAVSQAELDGGPLGQVAADGIAQAYPVPVRRRSSIHLLTMFYGASGIPRLGIHYSLPSFALEMDLEGNVVTFESTTPERLGIPGTLELPSKAPAEPGYVWESGKAGTKEDPRIIDARITKLSQQVWTAFVHNDTSRELQPIAREYLELLLSSPVTRPLYLAVAPDFTAWLRERAMSDAHGE
jgi:hypothetical protein